MLSRFSRRLFVVTILTVVFVLFAGKTASGTTTTPRPALPETSAVPPTLAEARGRLSDGFNEILEFFAKRDFSLLAAWHEMRASADPKFLEHKYPVISKELDVWATSLSRWDVSEAAVGRLDFTFLLEQIAPV